MQSQTLEEQRRLGSWPGSQGPCGGLCAEVCALVGSHHSGARSSQWRLPSSSPCRAFFHLQGRLSPTQLSPKCVHGGRGTDHFWGKPATSGGWDLVDNYPCPHSHPSPGQLLKSSECKGVPLYRANVSLNSEQRAALFGAGAQALSQKRAVYTPSTFPVSLLLRPSLLLYECKFIHSLAHSFFFFLLL